MRVVKSFERRQQSADDCLRIFVHKKHAASVGLRHARMNVSASLSDAYATPFPSLAHVSVLLKGQCYEIFKLYFFSLIEPIWAGP